MRLNFRKALRDAFQPPDKTSALILGFMLGLSVGLIFSALVLMLSFGK